ncbi:cyclic nucleotide-binding domain-containing protein, partial [bacterium]
MEIPRRSEALSEPVVLLEKSPLFAALAPAHRQQIAGYLTRHDYAAGAEIVRQGDPGDALYLVATGSVGMFVRDASLGITQLISTLEPPESFGEMALVSMQTQSGTCVAMAASTVYRLSKEIFHAVVGQSPLVALAVAGTLALRLENLTQERDIPWTSLGGRKFDQRLWSSLPELTLRQGRIVPLALSGRTLTVGMVDPMDTSSLDALGRALPGVRFKIFAVTAEDFQR